LKVNVQQTKTKPEVLVLSVAGLTLTAPGEAGLARSAGVSDLSLVGLSFMAFMAFMTFMSAFAFGKRTRPKRSSSPETPIFRTAHAGPWADDDVRESRMRGRELPWKNVQARA
jgi:hypothetical protein